MTFIDESIVELFDWLINHEFSSYKLRRLQCKLFGHPWEWTHFYPAGSHSGFELYCRWACGAIPKFSKMRAFNGTHMGDHKYGCELERNYHYPKFNETK